MYIQKLVIVISCHYLYWQWINMPLRNVLSSHQKTVLHYIQKSDNSKYGRWSNFKEMITTHLPPNMAWDTWTESCMKKGSKLKSGWLSIINNNRQPLVCWLSRINTCYNHNSINVNNATWAWAAHNALANHTEVKWKQTEYGRKHHGQISAIQTTFAKKVLGLVMAFSELGNCWRKWGTSHFRYQWNNGWRCSE